MRAHIYTLLLPGLILAAGSAGAGVEDTLSKRSERAVIDESMAAEQARARAQSRSEYGLELRPRVTDSDAGVALRIYLPSRWNKSKLREQLTLVTESEQLRVAALEWQELMQVYRSFCDYRMFQSQRALYEKAFDSYCQTNFAGVLKILNGTGSPLENVRALVSCWGNMDCKGCMVLNTLVEFGSDSKGVGKLAKKVVERLRQEFEEKLTAAKDAGELGKTADPKELAAFLVNTAQGLNVSAHAGAGKEVRQGVVNTTLAVLC